MKTAAGPIARVLITEPFYMAEDADDDLVVHPDFFKTGILINVTRPFISQYRESLTDDSRIMIRQVMAEQKIRTLHVPDLQAIFITGKDIESMKSAIFKGLPEPPIIQMLIRQLETYAAVTLDEPDRDKHYVFIQPGMTMSDDLHVVL